MKAEVGKYVKYLSNDDIIKVRKIGEMRTATKDGKMQTVLMVKAKDDEFYEYSYNVWKDEVFKIVTKETHPEYFL